MTTLCYLPRTIDQTIVTFILLKDEHRGSKTAKDIEEYSKTKLMEYMKPEFMIVDIFPQTISGKLDRQGLLELFGNWKRGTWNVEGLFCSLSFPIQSLFSPREEH